MGVNAAGISSKLKSFKQVVNSLKPSIIFVEESKLKSQGKFKLNKFVIYELNRKNKNGGGLAICVLEELQPVWISEGDDNSEYLVVEVDISGFKIRCAGGYGPQENVNMDKKKAFWDKLSLEVEDAMENEAGFIIQMDGNLWAGSDIIKNDPNPRNNNGKLFKEFLSKHPHLRVVNSLDLCQGLITRKRVTTKRTELAVLDFFIVCTRVLPYVEKMIVDEEKQYVLSNYGTKNGKSYKRDSDHNTMYLDLSLQIPAFTEERKELFNFKNIECQELFFEITQNSKMLSECFQSQGNIGKQSKKWFKTLKEIFHNSFRKIRITKKNKDTPLSLLFDKRLALKGRLINSGDEEATQKN